MAHILRFGILGCGVIGPTHAEAIASLPDAQLVAVADLNAETARQLAARYHARPYTDYQEMLAREQLDVVTVCTPSGVHGKHACQVMRSGRHVIMEKPMEISLAAIDEMLRVQQETGVRGTWQLDGGGVLMNQSIHSIDILQWLMGPVRSVFAYTDTLAHRMETEDVAVAVLRFVNGAVGTIAATTGAYPGVTTRIEIFGDMGSAIIENDSLSYLHLAREDQEEVSDYGAKPAAPPDLTRKSTTAQNPAALSSSGHALQIADMIRAIRENGTPLVDGYAARRPVEIILAIYESARTRQEVMLS
jgi:predicted dehydrogenase